MPGERSRRPTIQRKGTIVVPKGSNPQLLYCWNNKKCQNKIDYSIKEFDPTERDADGHRVQRTIRTRHFYRCEMCGCALYCSVMCMQEDFYHHRRCCHEVRVVRWRWFSHIYNHRQCVFLKSRNNLFWQFSGAIQWQQTHTHQHNHNAHS